MQRLNCELVGYRHARKSIPASQPVTMPESGADAPHASNSTGDSATNTLRDLCVDLNEKIKSFLSQKSDDPRVQSTQARTRESLKIVDEALDRYPYALGLIGSIHNC